MKVKSQKFEIVGGNKLEGCFENQTSKNATLPIMSASILCDGEITIFNTPQISDVQNMLKILKQLGVKVEAGEGYLKLNPKQIKNIQIDCKLAKTMRSSIFLLGSLLSRFGSAIITLPGGCKIGSRPIDIHIKSLKRLGVNVSQFGDQIFFQVKNPRCGTVKLRIPSVGATENIIQYACKIKGKTIIKNAAREPEVVDLCNFLNKMGAKILGAGTKRITIYGVDKLNSTTYKPINDRIVAGTIMIATAICGGNVTISNTNPIENKKLIEILRLMGCQIEIKSDIINIVRNKDLKQLDNLETGYYPNFPTDLQSCVLAMMTTAKGEGLVRENIFENRFLTVSELNKMGAKIDLIDSKTIKVKGVSNLIGTEVEAKDLRGGACLVLAALAAKGKTTITNIEHIDRGYENIEEVLKGLGVNIRRI